MKSVWILIGHHKNGINTDIVHVCESEAVALMFRQDWEHRASPYKGFSIIEREIFYEVNLAVGLQDIPDPRVPKRAKANKNKQPPKKFPKLF